jgi:hypothetical protein
VRRLPIPGNDNLGWRRWLVGSLQLILAENRDVCRSVPGCLQVATATEMLSNQEVSPENTLFYSRTYRRLRKAAENVSSFSDIVDISLLGSTGLVEGTSDTRCSAVACTKIRVYHVG